MNEPTAGDVGDGAAPSADAEGNDLCLMQHIRPSQLADMHMVGFASLSKREPGSDGSV